jgi:hypothetical protein
MRFVQISGYHSHQIQSKRSTGIRINRKAHSTEKAFELDRDVRGRPFDDHSVIIPQD